LVNRFFRTDAARDGDVASGASLSVAKLRPDPGEGFTGRRLRGAPTIMRTVQAGSGLTSCHLLEGFVNMTQEPETRSRA